MGQIGQAFDHISGTQEVKELSVVAYADSFFCGFWGEDNLLLKAQAYKKHDLKALLQTIQRDYQTAPVSFLSTEVPFVHLPDKYYSEESFNSYFKDLYDVRKRKEHNKVQDRFKSYPVHTLHYVEHHTSNQLKEVSNSLKESHISTALSNYLYLSDCSCIMFMHDQVIHICCHSEEGFLFYNRFYCADVNDYLYFSLMVLQHFKIDYSKMEIQLAGEIDRSSKVYIKLRSYLPRLRLMDDLVLFREAVESRGQVYFDLFLARTCV